MIKTVRTKQGGLYRMESVGEGERIQVEVTKKVNNIYMKHFKFASGEKMFIKREMERMKQQLL